MHLIALTWTFIVVLMAAAEATSLHGSVLGALFTLLLYGALPLAIVLYLLGTPMRRRARRRREAESAAHGDGGGHATRAAITPEREEP